MATKLSKLQLTRLENCLDRWAEWEIPEPPVRRPSVVKLLGEGTAHTAVELDTPVPTVARVPMGDLMLGLPRNQEFEIQRVAAAAGISPQPYFLDFATGVVVQEHVGVISNDVPLDALAELMRSIHSLRTDGPKLDITSRYRKYLDIASDGGRPIHDLLPADDLLFREAVELLESQELRLCHNDLTEGNIMMVGDKPMAVDWEYAALANPCFDLASATASFPENRKNRLRELLASDYDYELLDVARVVYDTVEHAWYRAAGISLPFASQGRADIHALEALL